MTIQKKHYATRDFTDGGAEAGAERHFTKGAELTDVEAGALANYVGGGLATTDKPETPAPAQKLAS